jgi:hypothetical protein
MINAYVKKEIHTTMSTSFYYKSTTDVHIEFQNFLLYTYVLKEVSSCGFPLEDLNVLKNTLSCTSSNSDSQFWTRICNFAYKEGGKRKE